MKIQIALVLMAALLPACGQTEAVSQAIKAAQTAASSDEAAANQLYLEDMVDSAGEEESSEEEAGEETAPEVDEAVEGDVKNERLEQMVSKIFAELDTDASGGLSLEEFLAGAEKRAEEREVSAEVKAKIVAKITADFNAAAGDDKALSIEEAKNLLKSSAPRVGRHRCKNFPGGQQQERAQETVDSLIEKFDTNKDGSLSREEIEAMIESRKAEVQKWKEERVFEGGTNEGRGPQAGRGPQGQGGRGPQGRGPQGGQPPKSEEGPAAGTSANIEVKVKIGG